MFSPVTINDTDIVPSPAQFFRLGMMYSTGETMPLDLVSAHKCFNIAAKYGIKDAIRLAMRWRRKCQRPILLQHSAPRGLGCYGIDSSLTANFDTLVVAFEAF